MWLPLIAFLLTTALGLAIIWLFVRSGSNRDEEVLTRRGPRPLLFGALTEPLSGVLPTSSRARQQLARFLRHAGHYHGRALAEFLALRNAVVVGWVLLAASAIVVATEPGDSMMYQIGLGALIVAVILYALPRLALEVSAKNRVQRIEESLPDALDMITMCTSGGLPLQSALVRVSDELRSVHPDLAFELRVVGRQMDAGSLEQALIQFANRLDAPEVHSLAAIIRQTQQQGSSVASAFERFADNVRVGRRQRADEAGNKTAVKMLFPLVFCLAPPVYLMLLAPAAIELRDFTRRESQPGGALSASAENLRPLLSTTPTIAPPATSPAATTETNSAFVAPLPKTRARPQPANDSGNQP